MDALALKKLFCVGWLKINQCGGERTVILSLVQPPSPQRFSRPKLIVTLVNVLQGIKGNVTTLINKVGGKNLTLDNVLGAEACVGPDQYHFRLAKMSATGYKGNVKSK